MIRNPILKVLSVFSKYDVKALLMGGQACILYGAAEFSRDIDLAVLVSPKNLHQLKTDLIIKFTCGFNAKICLNLSVPFKINSL
ncbi:MAG: hypothetical protein ABIA63_06900 [bacterium]